MLKLLKSLILLTIVSVSSQGAFAAEALLEAVGGAGSVTVKRAGKTLNLKKGDALEVGDEVMTGRDSAVDIRFEDKTLIRVGANTAYRLEGESKSFLHKLISGIVRVLVPPKADGKSGAVRFRMSTAEGTIGVRGTEFVVVAASGLTTLKGLEGEVLFGAAGADFAKDAEFVVVKRGYQSTVEAGGSPKKPSEFPLPAYLKEIDGRNGSFKTLAARSGTPVLKRSSGAPAPAIPKVAALKAQVKKAVAVDEKKPEPKAPKQEEIDEQLFLAASTGEMDKAKAALKNGAKVNSMHIDRNTPLHAAAVESKYEMMKFLLENGADVNAKNRNGFTPLMIVAFESGDAKAAVLLLDNKAKVGEADPNGVTALDLAQAGFEKDKKAWQEIYDLLVQETKDAKGAK